MSQPQSNITSVRQTKNGPIFNHNNYLKKTSFWRIRSSWWVIRDASLNSQPGTLIGWASDDQDPRGRGEYIFAQRRPTANTTYTHASHTSGVSHRLHYFRFLYPYIPLSLSEFLKVIHSLPPLFWHSPSFSLLSATPGRLTATTPPCLPKTLRRSLSHTHSPFLSIFPSPPFNLVTGSLTHLQP